MLAVCFGVMGSARPESAKVRRRLCTQSLFRGETADVVFLKIRLIGPVAVGKTFEQLTSMYGHDTALLSTLSHCEQIIHLS